MEAPLQNANESSSPNSVTVDPSGQDSNATAYKDSNATTVPNAQNNKLACKRGISAAADASIALSSKDLTALSSKVSWWYNWSSSPGSQDVAKAGRSVGVEFVPMIWTAPFDSSKVIASLSADTKYLLAFNEPNFTVQGNLTPQKAASYWPQIEKIAQDHNLAIVSPALNFCGGACNQTDPFVWFDQFFKACPKCRVDYLAVHAYVCYGSALTSVYLKPFAQKYGKKLWVTEISCGDGSADGGSVAVQKRYMQEAVAAMEADDNVFRYSWFLARTSSKSEAIGLLQEDGKLTELGQLYVSLPQKCDSP